MFVTMLFLSLEGIGQESKQKAPDFTLQNSEGNTVSLSDFRGKVIYLDFWATWCKPCMEEVPGSIKLSSKLNNDTNIVFIAVSIDSDVDRWKKMLEKKKMVGVQLISLSGKESDVLAKYNVGTIPRFVVIDKNGIIVMYDALTPREKGIAEFLKKVSQDK
jgi:peroxiredoxin